MTDDDEDFDRLRIRRVDYCWGRRDGYYAGRLDGYAIGILASLTAALLERLELLVVGVLVLGYVYIRIGWTRGR